MNPSPACFPLAIHFQNLGESKRAKRSPVFSWHGGGGMITLPTRTWMASFVFFFFPGGKGKKNFGSPPIDPRPSRETHMKRRTAAQEQPQPDARKASLPQPVAGGKGPKVCP